MTKSAARDKDQHLCAFVRPGSPPIPHVGGPVISQPDRTVFINGRLAATYGDEAECTGVGSSPPPKDSIVGGCLKVFINGQPAARITEKTYGGTVASGSPDVFYAESIEVLTEAAANWLHQYMAQQRDIPFNHPWDGCYARAHEMRRMMEEQFSVKLKKIFVYGNLEPVTGTLHSVTQPVPISWGYHVAPLVEGIRPDGSAARYVIDPSVSPNRVLTDTEWTRVSAGTGTAELVDIRDADAYAPNGRAGYVSDPGNVDTRATLKEKRELARNGDYSDPDADLSDMVAAKDSLPRPVVRAPHLP